MPTTRSPRHGSMQFWPRKRAKRIYARVRSYAKSNEAKILGFAGYKAGMTHVFVKDNRPNSQTKGDEIFVPVTIIECPPLKTSSIRFYKKNDDKNVLVSEIFSDNLDKELGKKIKLRKGDKKDKKKVEDIKEFDEIRLGVYTQPKLTGIGKKKPELFEMHIGGKKEEQLAYAKEQLGKEIKIGDVFDEGMFTDIHAITRAKGYQGPVKRFGIQIRAKKSEKTKRGPGSLGPWVAHAHIQYRVPKAGQMGYHQRKDYSKQILKIGDDPKAINPKGGLVNYGEVKGTYMLLKGSLPGPKKRLIRMSLAMRAKKAEAPDITHVRQTSHQG